MKYCVFIITLLAAVFIAYAAPPPQVTPVKKYTPPALSDQRNWMMVIIPDTQSYVKVSRNHGIADMMFTWIAENTGKLKIQQVLHTGDLVEHNRTMTLNPWVNNQTGPEQWQAVSRLFSRLDGVVPYVLATGNHDHGERCSEDRYSQLEKYFPPERNPKLRNVLRQCGPNYFGKPNLENAVYEFTTPNGQKILIVSLNFAPTDQQLAWAKTVFDRKEYANHFGILLTHAYMWPHKRIDQRIFKPEKIDGNIGEEIFQKLVKPAKNIRLVICGHISHPDDWRGCAGILSSKNDSGKTVYEMLFDPQALGGGWCGNGGDGWLRLLEFSADMKTIRVKTFSPFFANSPSTCHLAWHTGKFNDFTITYQD